METAPPLPDTAATSTKTTENVSPKPAAAAAAQTDKEHTAGPDVASADPDVASASGTPKFIDMSGYVCTGIYICVCVCFCVSVHRYEWARRHAVLCWLVCTYTHAMHARTHARTPLPAPVRILLGCTHTTSMMLCCSTWIPDYKNSKTSLEPFLRAMGIGAWCCLKAMGIGARCCCCFV